MSNKHEAADYEPHPIKRARERLGKDYDGSDLRKIADLITGEKSVLLGTCPKRGTQYHIVQYDGCTFTVVFDPSHNGIVTFFGKGFKLGRVSYNKRASGKRKRRGKYRGKDRQGRR